MRSHRNEAEQMTKDACWEFFKAEREVACLRRRIENHVAASKRMGAAWTSRRG